MTPHGRWGRRGGLGLVALAVVEATGCTPPCYDDGWFQKPGCPAVDSEGATGSDTASSSGTATAATEGAEGGVMTADGSGGSTTGPTECPGLDEDLSFGTPTFQLVVEQSDAMQAMFDGGTRFDVAGDALVDAVTPRQSTMRFGLTTFRGLQAGCPRLAGESPQLDAADEIDAVFGMEVPAGANPVADTVEDVTDDLSGDAWMGDKTIVLVLGSEPSTCALPAPANAVDLAVTRGAAEDAVLAAQAAGFPTVVVALGDEVDPGFLQVLANAGAGVQPGDPDATFFAVQDQAGLAAALDEILALSRPCSFALSQALPAELVPGCAVEVNGAPVDYDDPNGWSRPDEQTLELQGTACEAIQQGDASVVMVCSCDDV